MSIITSAEPKNEFSRPALSVVSQGRSWGFISTPRVLVTAKLSGAHWGVSRAVILLVSASTRNFNNESCLVLLGRGACTFDLQLFAIGYLRV